MRPPKAQYKRKSVWEEATENFAPAPKNCQGGPEYSFVFHDVCSSLDCNIVGIRICIDRISTHNLSMTYTGLDIFHPHYFTTLAQSLLYSRSVAVLRVQGFPVSVIICGRHIFLF